MIKSVLQLPFEALMTFREEKNRSMANDTPRSGMEV